MCKLFFCRRRRRLFRRSLAALSLPPSPSLALSHPQWFHFFGAVKAHYTARSLPLTLSICVVSLTALHLTLALHTRTHTLLSFVCSCLFCLRLLLIALSLIKSTVWQLAENGRQIKGAWEGDRVRERNRNKISTPRDICEIIIYLNSRHMCSPLHPRIPPHWFPCHTHCYSSFFLSLSLRLPLSPFPLDKYYEVVFICGDATPDLELSSSICCCRNTFLDSISLSFNLIIHALSLPLPLSVRTLYLFLSSQQSEMWIGKRIRVWCQPSSD